MRYFSSLEKEFWIPILRRMQSTIENLRILKEKRHLILFWKQLNVVNAYREVLITEYLLLAAGMLSHGRCFSAFRESATPKPQLMVALLWSFLNLKRVSNSDEQADIGL